MANLRADPANRRPAETGMLPATSPTPWDWSPGRGGGGGGGTDSLR